MAISAPSVWEIRPGGLQTNGSCYDAAILPGSTDYTRQDAAVLTLTDGGANTGTTAFTSATGGFTSAMVGNGIGVVQGGTYRGVWQIVAFVSSNEVTVDRNGPVTASDHEFRVGGANLLANNGIIFIGNVVAGNKIWVKGPGADAGDYTLSTNSVALSTSGSNVNPITMEGYTTTRGDGGRPTIKHSSGAINCLTVTGNFNIVKNLTLDASTGGVFALSTSALHTFFENVVCKNQAPCRVLTNGAQRFVRCRFTSSNNGDPGCEVQVSEVSFDECVFDSNSGSGVDIDDIGHFRNCIFHGNTLDGVSYADAGDDFGFDLVNCDIWNNGRDGVRISSTATDGGLSNITIRKSVFGKHASGYDINYTPSDISANTGAIEWANAHLDCNAFYTTGTGKMHNLPACSGDITLTASPFTSDTNFALNSVSGGGTLIRAGQCGAAFADDVNSGSYPLGALGIEAQPTDVASMLDLWRELTGEKDSVRVPDSVVYKYLNGGLEEVNRRGRLIRTTDSSIVFDEGTQEYQVPEATVEILWVEVGGRALKKSSIDEWQNKGVKWREQAAGVPAEWSFEDNRLIFLPKPDASVDGTSPTFRAVTHPEDIATNGFGTISRQYKRLVVHWAVFLWSGCYPDSGVAQLRAQTNKAIVDEALPDVALDSARKGVSR